MELSDEFVVPLVVEEAWAVLTDLARIAPCLPGAQLDEVEGDEYRGRVRVKVGPMTVEYKGVAHFLSRDETTRIAELLAEGRETRGQGQAKATVKATLTAEGDASTHVKVETNLDVSGRVAQFGRGVIADVSSKLLGQFVTNLERDLSAGTPATATEPPVVSEPSIETPTSTDAPSTTDAPSAAASTPADRATSEAGKSATPPPAAAAAAPVSAFSLIGPALLKRLSPIFLIGALIAMIKRGRRKSA